MTREELIQTLRELTKEFVEADQSAKIHDLQQTNDYLRNEVRQQEIKILRLENRLLDIRNLMVGMNDDQKART